MSFWSHLLDQNTNKKFDKFCPTYSRAEFVKFFVDILVQTMKPKRHFEINWPLAKSMEVCNNKVFGNNISMDGLESRWSKRRPLLAFTSALSLSPSKQLMLLFKNFSGIVFKTRAIWIISSMKSSPFNKCLIIFKGGFQFTLGVLNFGYVFN